MNYEAFLDELQKIAAAKARMTVSQSRAGRRSMSVDTLLRKDKEGTLFKDKLSSYVGQTANTSVYSISPDAGQPAAPKSKPGDVPSRDEGPTKAKIEESQNARGTTALVQGYSQYT